MSEAHITVGVAESVGGPGKFDTFHDGIMWMFGRLNPHDDMCRVLRARGFVGRVVFVEEATGTLRTTMTVAAEDQRRRSA